MAQTQRPATRIPDAEETDEERRQRAQHEEDEARREAEAATAHLPQPGTQPIPAMTADQVRGEGEAMVKMNFPTVVTLTLDDFRMVRFPAGVQDVPESLVDHQYLKDSGVTRV